MPWHSRPAGTVSPVDDLAQRILLRASEAGDAGVDLDLLEVELPIREGTGVTRQDAFRAAVAMLEAAAAARVRRRRLYAF